MSPLPERFEWQDDQAVVLRDQSPIAVYLNPYDGVVIRREAHWPDEDQDLTIVLTTADAAKRVAHAILGLVAFLDGKQHNPCAEPFELPSLAPKDATATDRQRRRRARLKPANGDAVTLVVTAAERDRDRDVTLFEARDAAVTSTARAA